MKSDLSFTDEKLKSTHAVYVWFRYSWFRKVVLLLFYAGGLALGFCLAYELRFDFAMDENSKQLLFAFLPWVVALQLILLVVFGQFEGLLSYFSLPDLRRLFWAFFLSGWLLGALTLRLVESS